MATTTTKRRRVNDTNPAGDIIKCLDEIYAKIKMASGLAVEYATNLDGQLKAEIDATASSLRGMFCSIAASRAKIEIVEDLR